MSENSELGIQLYGVDTLVAIPQYYINFNLAQLLAMARYTPTADQRARLRENTGACFDAQELAGDTVPISYLALYNDFDDAWLVGRVERMWVQNQASAGVAGVTFNLKLACGFMEYFQRQEMNRVDTSNWEVSFTVELSIAGLESGGAPEAVRKAIENLGNGAFSIQQLLMDFQNAYLNVGITNRNVPEAVRYPFNLFMTRHLETVKKSGGDILGYALQVNDPDSVEKYLPPTFAPTALEFRVNHYRGEESPPELNPSLDTINFLLMTRSKAFPGLQTLPQWWGNFVVPDDAKDGHYATMVLSKELFIDSYLLPDLAQYLNQSLDLLDQSGDLNPKATLTLNNSFRPTQLGGEFVHQTSSKSKKDNTFSDDDANYSWSVRSSVQAVPGTSKLTVDLLTKFDVQLKHWYGIRDHAASSTAHFWFEVPFKLEIILGSIVDGVMSVSVNDLTPPLKPRPTDKHDAWAYDHYSKYLVKSTRSGNPISDWFEDAFGGKPDTEPVQQMQMLLETSAFSDSATSLIRAALTQNHRFVFPAGGEFFMKHATFSNNGDLLISLKYKS